MSYIQGETWNPSTASTCGGASPRLPLPWSCSGASGIPMWMVKCPLTKPAGQGSIPWPYQELVHGKTGRSGPYEEPQLPEWGEEQGIIPYFLKALEYHLLEAEPKWKSAIVSRALKENSPVIPSLGCGQDGNLLVTCRKSWNHRMIWKGS